MVDRLGAWVGQSGKWNCPLGQVDYLERAKRLAELTLLEQHYEEQRLADREFHIEQENQAVGTKWNCMVCRFISVWCVQIAAAIRERKEGEEASVRLKVMRQDEAAFRKSLQGRRKQKHEVSVGG